MSESIVVSREVAGLKRDAERISELGLEMVRLAADFERHAMVACGGAGAGARRRASDRALGLIASAHARPGRRATDARPGKRPTGKGRSTGERGPGRPANPPTAAQVTRVKALRKDGKTFQQIDRLMGRPDRHGAWSWKIINDLSKRGTSPKKTNH